MKTLIIAISIFSSLNSNVDNRISLGLPDGLELGRTLRTDVDPEMISYQDQLSFFSAGYDAHFNQMGFLEKLVIDRDKKHALPNSWNLSWSTSIEELKTSLSGAAIEVVKRDVSKSPTVNGLTEVFVTINDTSFHFCFADWKDDNKADGLTRVTVSRS